MMNASAGAGADRVPGARPMLDALALVVIALMLCIVVQVAANAAGIPTLLRFETALPLLGRALTINALMELQWHLLTLIGLLPAALVWAMDRHVRVDFLYAAAPERAPRRSRSPAMSCSPCPSCGSPPPQAGPLRSAPGPRPSGRATGA
jgi:hypothetical protein